MTRLALVVVAIAALTGACSRDLRPPITIGIVSPCRGTFGALYEPTLAAAELPLIARGATPRGTLPSQGLRSANTQGRPVRVVLGCSDGSAETAIREARRLVEAQGAQILIGALVDPEGLALQRYAARQPGVTFITTSSDQSVTLEHPRANLYRFASDSAQSIAGLGSYAYRRLHWRNVVILGQPTSFGYGEAAGFASEFCSLGGDIEARMWAPAGTEAAKAAVARLSLGNVDGAAVFSLTGGLDLIRAFAPRGPLRGKVVVDVILGAAGDDGRLRPEGRRRRVGLARRDRSADAGVDSLCLVRRANVPAPAIDREIAACHRLLHIDGSGAARARCSRLRSGG